MKKNLVLDIGNVLMSYRWKDMFMDFGLSEEDALRVGGLCFDDPLWNEMDRGRILEREVMEIMCSRYPGDAEAFRHFFTHAELMVVERPRVWEMVRNLKDAGFAVYLLSNYSENFFYKQIWATGLLPYVDGAVISYQVHCLKPEKEIYRILFDRYHLDRRESIFFDDRAENVEAARSLGMDSCLVTDEEGLLQWLSELLDAGEIRNPYDWTSGHN